MLAVLTKVILLFLNVIYLVKSQSSWLVGKRFNLGYRCLNYLAQTDRFQHTALCPFKKVTTDRASSELSVVLQCSLWMAHIKIWWDHFLGTFVEYQQCSACANIVSIWSSKGFSELFVFLFSVDSTWCLKRVIVLQPMGFLLWRMILKGTRLIFLKHKDNTLELSQKYCVCTQQSTNDRMSWL